jgi:uncharacterized membrane protein SirB2
LRIFMLGVLAMACGAMVASSNAQEILVSQYSWKALAGTGKVDASLVHEEAGHGTVCEITNATDTLLRRTLLKIESPAITADFYRLDGEVRYAGVEGDGYLEMWSTFPPATPGGTERSFFSRTLANENQMGKLHGTSDWRAFVLPFDAAGAGAHPIRLTFNVVLPGIKLWQVNSPSAGTSLGKPALFAGNGWLLFPLSLVACSGFGGLIVSLIVLCEWMAARGRDQEIVQTLGVLTAAFSVSMLAIGIWLQHAQPVALLWGPWLAAGLFGVVVPLLRLLTLRKRYRAKEIRRMTAFDALA